MNTPKILALLFLPLFAVCAQAATPIDERRPVNADVQVRVENIAGSVKVRAGASDSVTIHGTLADGARPLRVEGDARRLSIIVEPESREGRGRRMSESHLEISMPASARLEVQVVSASIDVEGINGAGIELESVSGDIGYQGDATRVHLKSVSGDVTAQGAGRDWNVGTVSGGIVLPRAAGVVRAETVSGDVEVHLADIERVRMESVSGALSASGSLGAAGSLAMQSVSGVIELELAAAVDARIRASTFSGRVESSIGTPERSGIGGGYRLDTVAGSGAGDVRLESFSGRIRIGTAR